MSSLKGRKARALGLGACVMLPIWAAAASTDPQISTARLSADVKTLSSDAFEGRGVASAGETKTVAYLIQQMKAAGLKPGGPQVAGVRQWTQQVPLIRSEIIGSPQVRLQVGGKTVALAPREQISIRASPVGGKAVSIVGAPLVFVGYGVSAPEHQWDDFKGIDLKGKVAVVLINDPDFETGVGAFEGKAMTYYGRWTYKHEEIARRGALGVLIVHENDPAGYGWATVKNSDTVPTFDVVRADPTVLDVPLEAWIQREVAVQLFTDAGLDFETLKRQAQSPTFRPVPMAARLNVAFTLSRSSSSSQNVIGLLP